MLSPLLILPFHSVPNGFAFEQENAMTAIVSLTARGWPLNTSNTQDDGAYPFSQVFHDENLRFIQKTSLSAIG
jgi:hypothetical protein